MALDILRKPDEIPAAAKHAVISGATTGAANTIIAAVAGKRILVLNYNLMAASAVTHQWFSDTTALSGPRSLPATGGLVANYNPAGWIITAVGEALKMTLGGAVQVSGEITYIEID